jgi:hypothetical protein
MRRLPHQGVDHGTVDHGLPSDGVFLLLHERVLPSRWLISLWRSSSSLSLACGWPSCTNDSLFGVGGASGLLGLKILRVQEKRDRTGARTGLGRPAWADRPGPTSARFGRTFCSLGAYALMYFSPSTCMILMMLSSRSRWRFSSHEVRSFTLQSQGVFLVALRSLPPLEVISSSS